MNGTRHVVLALTLSAIVFVIAGDSWNANVRKITPIQAAPKR